jgi:hypothetical protein
VPLLFALCRALSVVPACLGGAYHAWRAAHAASAPDALDHGVSLLWVRQPPRTHARRSR